MAGMRPENRRHQDLRVRIPKSPAGEACAGLQDGKERVHVRSEPELQNLGRDPQILR